MQLLKLQCIKMPLAIPTLHDLSGKERKSKLYILYPEFDKVRSCNLDLETEARQLLEKQNVGDPVKTLLQLHYAILKVENTGNVKPYYLTLYHIKLNINQTTIQNDKPALKSIIGFMRVIDKAAGKTMLPWWCKVYNFDSKTKPIHKLHGYGSRALELELEHFRSNNTGD